MLQRNMKAPSLNITSISQAIDDALASAGLAVDKKILRDVTATIDRALAAAGLTPLRTRAPVPAATTTAYSPAARQAVPKPRGDERSEATDVGQFLSRLHASAAGSRHYRLYVPSSYNGQPVPLIVMLHGCRQDAADFARGTRMNAQAEQHGFLVAYPEQTARENGSNCWNWFKREEQHRDGTEPALIAGIVRDLGKSYAVDASRVFVAGLSAGAAMAVILGQNYPELFAGVAAHSGLPVGAAHDMASAFAAMHVGAPAPRAAPRGTAVPTIVFHGDADHTVVHSNGAAIAAHAVQGYAASDTSLRSVQRTVSAAGGSSVSATAYVDAGGTSRVEEWVVHGGTHGWFGGSAEGSYTDPAGPDASAEMVRFFLSQTS